ncbi:MAG: IS66 family insertion sequence element accessory protein TnpB [Bacteroidaceae bacterium]|nr:IS66 family insertion sequence element accessory protein TnpB [Bacteroidaceae bacterium]
MFGLEDSRRYYVSQRYVRMNLGINGLSKLVSQELKRPLLNGDVFIFFGKNRQTVKLLCWDSDGFLLYQKRLEKGTFELPRFKPGLKAVEMPYRTLSAIMRGVSLKSVRYRSRLRIGSRAVFQPSDYQ